MCAVILLMVIVTIKSPIIYYFFLLLLNNQDDKPFLLTCFVVDAFYLLSWLCLWCCLAIKHDWDFNLTVPGSTYRPNMSGIVNPPPPRNLFDPYNRDEKTTTVYVSVIRNIRTKPPCLSNPVPMPQSAAQHVMDWCLHKARKSTITRVSMLTIK
jgi:hypothetical protein